MANHQWDLYFETDSKYWEMIQDVYKQNEHWPKKQIKGRELHHKFMRSFSRLENKPDDNDKDNLVSLSYGEHFLVHYYLWKCTKKGFRNRTALPVRFLAKKGLSKISDETALLIAKDMRELKKTPHLTEYNKSLKGKKQSQGHIDKVRAATKKYDVPYINVKTLEVSSSRANVTRMGGQIFSGSIQYEPYLQMATPICNDYWVKKEYYEATERIFNVRLSDVEDDNEKKYMIKTTLMFRCFARDGRYDLVNGIFSAFEDGELERFKIYKNVTEKQKSSYKKLSILNKGKHWFNNGLVNVRSYDCPEGFVPGMIIRKEEK